jgi:hypothetical protein
VETPVRIVDIDGTSLARNRAIALAANRHARSLLKPRRRIRCAFRRARTVLCLKK